VLVLVMLFSPSILRCQRTAGISTCEQVTQARPGFGVSYKDTVRNSDYELSATVPEGLIGWGAAPVAPFHGFTIYLGPGPQPASCIVFEIAIHVDLGEDRGPEPEKSLAERVKVGNRTGSKIRSTGTLQGTPYENVTISLELPRSGYRNDVLFLLVTPSAEAARTEPIFTKFLASFRFGSSKRP